jgi:hypothetical protein
LYFVSRSELLSIFNFRIEYHVELHEGRIFRKFDSSVVRGGSLNAASQAE